MQINVSYLLFEFWETIIFFHGFNACIWISVGVFFIILNIYTETCKQEMTNYNALNLIGMCGVFLR